MTEWLQEFESTIKRLNKAEKSIKKEIMDLSAKWDKEIKKKLDQIRLIKKEKERIIDETLSNGNKSREDVEWDLLDLSLNGRNNE
jgi:Fe-S cluster assembly ATPase SufC